MAQDGATASPRNSRRPAAPRKPRRSLPGSGSSLPLVRNIRSRGEAAFRHHGRWISKHQIRTLLLCSLVITSLFYPAVGIYFWASKGGPGVSRGDAKSVWRSLSTPFMDSFASSGRKHVNSLSDLRMIWDDARDLRAIDVSDAQALLNQQALQIPSATEATHTFSRPRCQAIRVEHVFVTTDDVMAGRGPRFGVLEKRILHSALQLQKSVETELQNYADHDTATGLLACVQARSSFPGRPASVDQGTYAESDAACLTLSPLEYWNMDAQTILDDDEPAQFVSQSFLNKTRLGSPISYSTTLAGKWHLFKRLPRAEFLAFTFFLREDPAQACSDGRLPPSKDADRYQANHNSWHELLNRVTGGQVRLIASPENISHSLVLQFAPDTHSSKRRPKHIFLLTAYAFVIIYISRGLIKLRKVHSRFGLAFTGTTQLLISMVMSVSICALLGIRLALVPWELLPFVIVVVGSENMFSLTKAIVDTPLSLTVSSRIAHGLGKVGVPITLTTLADILLLLVIALFIGVRAVREFCIFAIFSLIMDWFLQMTFFITVLSIDMQRLELADLLTQGTRLSRKQDSAMQAHDGPNGTNGSADYMDGETSTDGQGRIGNARLQVRSGNIVIAALSKMWKARTARTASLTLILVYMGGLYLYYGTGFPSQQQSNFVLPADWDTVRTAPTSESTFDPLGHLDTKSQPFLPWWTSSPSADLWTSLNPLGAQELRINVEPWTILSLRSSSEGGVPPSTATFAGWALFRPRIRAVVWFAKLVVLPISGTTALLWMLLLYLLKDTELLDAQRDKSEAEPLEGANGSAVASALSSLKPRTTILATAHPCDVEFLVHDGDLAASIDNGGGLRVWKYESGGEDAERRSSINKARTGLPSEQCAVAALALSAEARWLAVGHASGRVTFISTDTLEAIWDHLPADSASAITFLTLQPHESMHTLESATVLSAHRDGTIHIWNVARKEVKLVDSQTQLDSRLPWRSLPVIVTPSPTSNNGPAPSRTTFLGFTTADGKFHIRAVDSGGASTKTVFTLSIEDRSHVCSALLCQLASRPPSADEAPLLRSTLLLGFANGRVRLIDFETAENVSSADLDDGPVVELSAVDTSEITTSTFVAQTSGRASLLVVSAGFPAAAIMEKSGSIHSSVGAFMSGSSLRIRTPNGSRANAAAFWGDGSTPPSPASELANPLSYPMSSHGSASRLRRTSAHMRDRSSTGGLIDGTPQGTAASSSLSVFPNVAPPTINATQKADDRQLRLLGWVRCQRGGSFAIGTSSLLVGIGRAQRSRPQSRWEWWSLDLRDELVLGRGGELLVPRQPLLLQSDQTARIAPARSSLQRQRTNMPSLEMTSFDDALSFSRLHPIHGFAATQRQESALLFGFGGSVGYFRVKSFST
ncbi:related to Sterol regulatory element binding protein cleavage-activating protein [Melanopsichium pennsylvanicum]|uniref:Sterol regulatory element-binding protein cleavage-activating protein n=2 Tax=Melanopsichium pennsylvanicum TaxID=63383 RepID=A0AAJ5C526_9BASI|nr:related to Sterol regulatory element binding protein cleavage-activating protein [Melanopsichium pennsylvanicum 4]SNX84285.1 related to Sterol regulatory element binding protein cleavage-activating protein [Melanopsichium pennsylvanicum]